MISPLYFYLKVADKDGLTFTNHLYGLKEYTFNRGTKPQNQNMDSGELLGN